MNEKLIFLTALCGMLASAIAAPSAPMPDPVDNAEKKFTDRLKKVRDDCAAALKPVEMELKQASDEATSKYQKATQEALDVYLTDLQSGMDAVKAQEKYGSTVTNALKVYQAAVNAANFKFEDASRKLMADCTKQEEEVKNAYLNVLRAIKCPDADCQNRVDKLINSLTGAMTHKDRAKQCKEHMAALEKHFSVRLEHAKEEHQHQIDALNTQLANGSITQKEFNEQKQTEDEHFEQGTKHHEEQHDEELANAKKSCS